MDITNVKITKDAKAETENARYLIEYSVNNGQLERVIVTVIQAEKDEMGNELYIGSITSENDTINCALPMSNKMALYFADFEGFVATIKEDVATFNK